MSGIGSIGSMSEQDLADLNNRLRAYNRAQGIPGPAPTSAPAPVYGGGQNIEAPSPLVSIGRGMTDVYQPIYSYLLNPEARQHYDVQRQADEALYTRGLLGTTTPGQSSGSDMWRNVGRYIMAAPLLPTWPATLPEAIMSAQLTSGLYNAVNTQRQRYGGLPDLPPTDWVNYALGSSPSPNR